jgi:hypothetical protein
MPFARFAPANKFPGRMNDFSQLLLRASQVFGAPAYVASIVKRPPYDVYRWIAGLEQPHEQDRRQLEDLLRVALHRSAALPRRRRRWSDASSPA